VEDAEGVLADMLAHRDELVRKSSAREADWAIQNARVVAQWARMTVARSSGSNVRDECMAENVAWILAQEPEARIVLWAHNGHVSRLHNMGVEWMGSYLERLFPGEMVVFGFATGSGAYTAIEAAGGGLKSDHPLHAPPADSVESFLASAGLPRFLLDIRGARPDDPATGWAASSHPMRSIGALSMEEQFFPCVARDGYDVLVWQAQTTASVPLRP
jgi:erythromycin esterase